MFSRNEKKVLIVEDEIILAMNIKAMLERHGYSVCGIGTTALEAVNLTEKNNPDLILMDINLNGEKDGIDAVEAIKVKHHIPVVYVTAYSDQKTMERVLKTRPQGFITKTLSDQDLLVAVDTAISRHQIEVNSRETERRLRKLYSCMGKGFAYCKIISDDDNNPVDWVFSDVNDEFENITGVLRNLLIDRYLSDIINKDGLNTVFLMNLFEMFLIGSENKFEVYIDNLERWIEVNFYSYDKESFFILIKDITNIKFPVNISVQASEILNFFQDKKATAWDDVFKKFGVKIFQPELRNHLR